MATSQLGFTTLTTTLIICATLFTLSITLSISQADFLFMSQEISEIRTDQFDTIQCAAFAHIALTRPEPSSFSHCSFELDDTSAHIFSHNQEHVSDLNWNSGRIYIHDP